MARARQVGLKNAIGEYVLILDSDDTLIEGSLEKFKSEIQKNPDVDFFYTDNIEVYPSGSERFSNYPKFGSNKAFLHSIFRRSRVPFKHSGTMYKREKVLSLGGYDENLKIKIDIDLVAKILSKGLRFKKIDGVLVRFFFFHKDSISRDRVKGIKIWWVLIDRYIQGILLSSYLKLNRLVIELSKKIFEIYKLRR